MKKKIIIGVVAVVVILATAFFFLNNRNRTLSPPGAAELSVGDLKVSISYSRPSARGRVIFGSEAQGALQPNGKYWRLGANESTEITISRDASFNGQPMKAGTYRIYAIPGESAFEIRLNSALGKWGAFEPDSELDVLKTSVNVSKNDPPVEQYTITLELLEKGIQVKFAWSDTNFSIPITVE